MIVSSVNVPKCKHHNGALNRVHEREKRGPYQLENESAALFIYSSVDMIKPSRLRNIGIIAHINAGKTTTTERILYHAGSTDSVGDVDRGNTITDYLVQERDRGITITSAAVSFDWKKHRVNLIDTPGHVDFTMEVERSLSVLDGAVTILDASAGVEAQTITVWNQAFKYKLPNIIFLNKYDKAQANYKMCLADLRSQLDTKASLIQLPIKDEKKSFSSIIDIVDRKLIKWDTPDQNYGANFTVDSLDDAKNVDKKLRDTVEEEREKLVNYLTDIDDKLASHVIECDKISQVSGNLLSDAIRAATLDCKLSPVLLGSSFKYIGVQQLMDAIINNLPSPIEREKQILAEMGSSFDLTDSKSLCGFIFKITHDKRLGSLSYIKLCSGSISKLQRLKSLEGEKTEQAKKVYRVFADEFKEITSNSVEKYDIVAVTGLSESRTGDIVVEPNFKLVESANVTGLPFQVVNNSIIVPQINRLEPVYYCSIESRTSSQQVKLEHALACMSREDPSFTYELDERGITTIRGMGKLHLEICRDRLESEHNIDSLLGPLQIAYRETISEAANEELSVSRLVNSVKSTLEIKIYVRPEPQAGIWTSKRLRLDKSGDNALGQLRGDHRKAIESGFASALSHGPSMGFPLIDCDILLLDFKANSRCSLPVISSAASQCLMNAIRRCSPVLLEPIMLLEVTAPVEFNGSVLSDISARRGLVQSTTARGNGTIVIRSHTPLAALSDYSEFLRIVTSGRGSFSMELHSYSAMSEPDKQSLLFP